MTEPLGERLEELEKAVEARGGGHRDAPARSATALAARLGAGEADRAELQRLRQERKEMLTQVDAILKELDKLDL